MRTLSSIRHVAPGRLALMLVVTGLLTLAFAPSVIRAAGCTTEVATGQSVALPAERQRPGLGGVADGDLGREPGLDFEVRVLNLRIQFPWMKALPISPGHHIVITLLPGREPVR